MLQVSDLKLGLLQVLGQGGNGVPLAQDDLVGLVLHERITVVQVASHRQLVFGSISADPRRPRNADFDSGIDLPVAQPCPGWEARGHCRSTRKNLPSPKKSRALQEGARTL